MSADECIPNIVVDDAGSGFDDGTTSVTASPISKRSRVRELAKRTKQKTKNILNLDKNAESDPEIDVQGGDIFADPAFNPAKVIDRDPAQPSLPSAFSMKEKLNAVARSRQVCIYLVVEAPLVAIYLPEEMGTFICTLEPTLPPRHLATSPPCHLGPAS
jgi:hypothetical protein